MTDTALPTPEQATQLVAQTIPQLGRMGLRVERIEHGLVELALPIEGNGNHVGTMYAGALFAIAEVPGGVLPLTVFDPTRFAAIVKDVRLTFVRPARTDVTLTAALDPATAERVRAEAEERGRADFTLDLEACDAEGTVVARSHATYQLRRL